MNALRWQKHEMVDNVDEVHVGPIFYQQKLAR